MYRYKHFINILLKGKTKTFQLINKKEFIKYI